MLRLSLGDLAIIHNVKYVRKDEEEVVFWIIFILVILNLNIIFINFIIAEVSKTYNTVE